MNSLLLLFLLCFSLPVYAQESDTQKTDAETNNEKIIIATAAWAKATEEDLSGYYFDIARRIYEPRGFKLEVIFVPYKRSLFLVRNKTADALLGTYSAKAEAKDYLITPQYPIDTERTVAVYRQSDGIHWQGEKSLEGKKVAWILGYDYQHSLSVPYSLKEVTDAKSGLRMLDVGRIDFYLDAALDVLPLLQSNDYAFTSETILENYLYIAFANTERGKRLASIYDTEFIKLYETGEIDRIFKKYQLESRIKLPSQ